MTALLSAAGRSFLRAFFAALLVLSVGVLAAPDLNEMYLFGVAAIVGALAAGVRALTAYAPRLSLVSYLGHPYGDWADSFLHAFVSTLLVTIIGILGAPDLHTARALEWRLDAAAELDGESLSGSAHARPEDPTGDRGNVPRRAVEQPGSSPDS
jgi:hypothetical protein